jgi:hypothetical protein
MEGMNALRRRLALIWVGTTAAVATVVAFVAYQAGWAAGAAARLPEAAVAPYPGYYYGPHLFGFGFLPFLFLLLVLFLVFRGGRRWGYRRYGPPPQPAQAQAQQAQPLDDPWQERPQRPPSGQPAQPTQTEQK